ncbi:LLM class flavin-dependent oxidoreductase [Naumannella huperziae]
MPVTLHWFLPSSGDTRADPRLADAVSALSGTADQRRDRDGIRVADPDYLGQIARAAEQLGFVGALTPTSSECHDAWILGAALAQHTERLKFLVAFRPGLISPTLAAEQAAAFQRFSGGRLLLNIVTGGEDAEQRRYGDGLSKDERYARTGEFLHIFSELWRGEPVSFAGERLWVDDAVLADPPAWPTIYFGGSSPAAIEVAARHAEVYLTWGEPPAQVTEKLDRVRAAAARHGRAPRFGIRLHVIARPDAADAWQQAERLIAGLSPDQIARAQAAQATAQSEGQRRMTALHGGDVSALEIAPNLWAGIGLVRGGAGTALVGSYDEVADRIGEYHRLGIDEFILSGYPHLEEAYHVGEGVRPALARRGLLADAENPLAGVA